MTGIAHETRPTLLLGGELAFAQIAGVSLVVSKVPRWTASAMEEFIVSSFRLTGRETLSRANVSHFLGDSPGPLIRKQMVTVLERLEVTAAPRTAVLTDSAVLRNMMIAWTWLTSADARTFSPGARREALAWAAEGDDAVARRLDDALVRCYGLVHAAVPILHSSTTK